MKCPFDRIKGTVTSYYRKRTLYRTAEARRHPAPPLALKIHTPGVGREAEVTVAEGWCPEKESHRVCSTLACKDLSDTSFDTHTPAPPRPVL